MDRRDILEDSWLELEDIVRDNMEQRKQLRKMASLPVIGSDNTKDKRKKEGLGLYL